MRISDWSSDVCSSDLTGRPCPEPGGRRDRPDGDGLDEHAAGDEWLAPDAIGQATGDELSEAPDRGVDGGADADASDRQASVGEEQREQPPGESVVQVVTQPGL